MPSCAFTLPSANVFGVDAEKPLGLDHLKAFVHQRRTVDGHLAAHAPVGVLEGLRQGYRSQFLSFHAAEGAAAGGEQYLVHRADLAHEALEDGRMLAVHGQYRHTVLTGLGCHYGAGHHHGLLVGQCDGLAALYGMQRGPEACHAYNCRQHHVDALHLHEAHDGLRAGKDLDIGVTQRVTHIGVTALVGYRHGVGAELASLLYQQVGIATRAEHLGTEQVGMTPDDVERLGADRACGA